MKATTTVKQFILSKPKEAVIVINGITKNTVGMMIRHSYLYEKELQMEYISHQWTGIWVLSIRAISNK